MTKKTKSPKEAANVFQSIIKAAVKGNPKPKVKIKNKKKN